ncbi:MAG: adenylate kinase [Candidatus Aminicenantes bacterium]|nr:adenylate kinase [Candidatus Aminicenantes bacterium]
MRLILLGAPGSGKGTQGDLIEKKFGFPKISAGDLLRKAVNDMTSIGKKAQHGMQKGELVKDHLIIELIKQRIQKNDCKDGYILDGFPRNLSQAYSLEKIDPGQKELAVDIQIHKRTVMKRLSSRYICSKCNHIYNINKEIRPSAEKKCEQCGGKLIQRKDDKPEVIKNRLAVYHQKTEPVINYYKKKGVYKAVNGESIPQVVFEQICSIINESNMEDNEVEAVS